jgi:hypothetical protein
VAIGYGAGGDPLVFTLNPGEVSDTGFLKLFVFSKYVEMSWLRQGAAFDAIERRKVRRVSTGAVVWDAWVSAVTVFTKPWSSGSDSEGL